MKNSLLFVLFLSFLAGSSAQSGKDEKSVTETRRKIIIIRGDGPEADSLLKAEGIDTLMKNAEDAEEDEAGVENEETPLQNNAVIGIRVEDAGGRNGVSVQGVIKGSGADKAGLMEGDIIFKVNGDKIADYELLMEKLSSLAPGDKVKLKLLRDGEVMSKTVVLGKPAAARSESCPAGGRYRNTQRRIILRKEEKVMDDVPEKIEERKEDETAVSSERTIHEESHRNLRVSLLAGSPEEGKSRLTISFTGDKSPFTVKVKDSDGKELFSDSVSGDSARYEKEIVLGRITGSVVVQVLQGGEVSTAKLILD